MNSERAPPAPAATGRAEAEVGRLDANADHYEPAHDGQLVHWRRWGGGPPLVLIHGGHGSWLHWIRVIEPLAARFAVWAPDLPGYGDSDDLPVRPHDPDRQRRLVETVAATWGQLLGRETPVGLVGFSFGGLVSGQLAASGLAVRRLALLGSAGHRTARRPMAPLVNWRLADREASRAALRLNLVTFMLHDPGTADELALLAHEQASRRTRYRSKQMSVGVDLARELVPYRGPVRMIWGGQDVTAADPDRAGAKLADGRSNRDWYVVPGAGHWVQYEAPEATLRLLEGWLLA